MALQKVTFDEKKYPRLCLCCIKCVTSEQGSVPEEPGPQGFPFGPERWLQRNSASAEISGGVRVLWEHVHPGQLLQDQAALVHRVGRQRPHVATAAVVVVVADGSHV